MKIMVAPDSFKGSLTAKEVVENISQGINKVIDKCQIIKIPMADGGEGTVQSLVDASEGKIYTKQVTGPLGGQVKAFYGILGDGETAVIEMAAASGLPLVPEDKRDPSKTTTYGTGELIKAVLDKGIAKIIIGIGGSSTNDAGVGMAQALGGKFLDETGKEIGFGGGELGKVEQINLDQLDPRIKETTIEVACDVDNPLFGPRGAACVYAPQKGADSKMVQKLDKNLQHLSKIIKRDLGKDVQTIPGAGAAGGLGAGLVAFLDGELRSGIEIVLEINKVAERMAGVDLVITGEGQIDGQSVYGKTPVGVAKIAAERQIPVIAFCGSTGKGVKKVFSQDIDAVFTTLQQPLSIKEIFAATAEWLEFTTEQVMKVYQL
ncbi:MAG: glycerate kinase [bacterium]